MAGIEGRAIGIRIGNDFVPCETSCSLQFEVDKLSTSSNLTGSWRTHRNGYKSWSMSVDGKLLVSSMNGSFNRLLLAFLNDEPLTVYMSNRNPNGQPFVIWGNATIKNGSLEAPNVGKATWNVVFEGNGALNSDIQEFWEILNAMPYDADKPTVVYT